MTIDIPARLLTPLIPALLRAVECAEFASMDCDLSQRDRDLARQDARDINELESILRAALHRAPYTVADREYLAAMTLPEPVYIAVPDQLPPRVSIGNPPDDAHDLALLYRCDTVADLHQLANPHPRSDAHQRAAVASLARRELDRILPA